jgi:hypothetical protein
VQPGDGTDARLDELVRRPEVTRLHLRAPGILALTRLQESLRAEQNAEAARQRDRAGWPRPFRLLEGKRHALGERDLLPGEVIELTEAQAAAFADKFEPVPIQ